MKNIPLGGSGSVRLYPAAARPTFRGWGGILPDHHQNTTRLSLHPLSPTRSVPLRALFISLAALAVPVLVSSLVPTWLARDRILLVWIPAFVPAFLLSYHRGWKGSVTGFAAAIVALALAQTEVTALGLGRPVWGHLLVTAAAFAAVAVGAAWITEVLHHERDRAERSALTDPLTGLSNRRHASVFLETAWASALRGRALALILFDLDDFKSVNDHHGHAEGDRILAEFADMLRARTRRMDLSARFGGEEFMTILSDCTVDQAEMFARQVTERLAATDFGWGGITVSAGVSGMEEAMGSPDVLVAAADRALYAAKTLGRNRVCRADRPLSTIPTQDAPPTEAPRPSRDIRGLKILLVDDDADTLAVTRRLLERLGCAVTSAPSARAAVDILKSDRPIDLLVTDIVMPEMSGFTLVDLTSSVRPSLPVLYISGYPQEEVYWGGTPGAQSAFLAKPMEIDKLREAVRSLLPRGDRVDPSARPPWTAPPLPVAASPGHVIRPEEGEEGVQGKVLAGRILVIDDDEWVVRTLQRLFQRAGYEHPIGLTDPRKARDVLVGKQVDLIILDLHMPQMDGFEVLAEIRPLLHPEEYLPVVVLTGDDDPELRRRALAAGAMDFLAKPFDPAEAEARVRNLLAARFLTERVSHQRDELEDWAALTFLR